MRCAEVVEAGVVDGFVRPGLMGDGKWGTS